MSSKDILDPVLITFAALLPFAAMALLGYVVWLRVRHLRCKAGRHDWVQMDNGDRRCRSCKLVRKFVEPKPVVAKPPVATARVPCPHQWEKDPNDLDYPYCDARCRLCGAVKRGDHWGI
jgi:hypothetical protein